MGSFEIIHVMMDPKYNKRYFDKCYEADKDLWSHTNKLPLFQKFIRYLKDEGKKRVLDLGCGTGRVSILLGEKSFHVLGIDYSTKAIEKARNISKDKKLSGVSFKVGDILNYNFKTNYFDAIVDIGVLHHLSKKFWNRYISLVKRTLKEEGLIYLREFSIHSKKHFGFIPSPKRSWHIHQNHYDRFLSKTEIIELFQGFKIVDFEDTAEGTASGAPVLHSYNNCILRYINC